MKKLFLLLAIVAVTFASCSKDESESTTYTVRYNVEDAENISTDLTFYEYDKSGVSITNTTVSNCRYGSTKVFTASASAQKVKVHLSMTYGGQLNQKRWVSQVYTLNKGGNVDIRITETTTLSTQEP